MLAIRLTFDNLVDSITRLSVAVSTVAFGGLTSGRQTAALVEGLGDVTQCGDQGTAAAGRDDEGGHQHVRLAGADPVVELLDRRGQRCTELQPGGHSRELAAGGLRQL